MCTLIALWRRVPTYDLVVGMNRDESATRPADAPAFLGGNPPIVAPRDRKAGGSWIGVNGEGLVVALSNRRGPPSSGPRSRGLLVLEALGKSTPVAVEILLQQKTEEQSYNPWNLMALNRDDLRFLTYDGAISMTRGHEGLNVLTNEGANVVTDSKTVAVQNLLAKAPTGSIHDTVRTMQSALRTHGAGSNPALCVHRQGGGTVSSILIALNNADPSEDVLLYADGPPCSTPFRDYGEAIRRLSRAT